MNDTYTFLHGLLSVSTPQNSYSGHERLRAYKKLTLDQIVTENTSQVSSLPNLDTIDFHKLTCRTTGLLAQAPRQHLQ